MPRYEKMFHTQLRSLRGQQVIFNTGADVNYSGTLVEILSDYVVVSQKRELHDDQDTIREDLIYVQVEHLRSISFENK